MFTFPEYALSVLNAAQQESLQKSLTWLNDSKNSAAIFSVATKPSAKRGYLQKISKKEKVALKTPQGKETTTAPYSIFHFKGLWWVTLQKLGSGKNGSVRLRIRLNFDSTTNRFSPMHERPVSAIKSMKSNTEKLNFDPEMLQSVSQKMYGFFDGVVTRKTLRRRKDQYLFTHYYSLPYYPGKELYHFLIDKKNLTFLNVSHNRVQVVLSMLKTMQSCFNNECIPADVKTENLIIRRDKKNGTSKLLIHLIDIEPMRTKDHSLLSFGDTSYIFTCGLASPEILIHYFINAQLIAISENDDPFISENEWNDLEGAFKIFLTLLEDKKSDSQQNCLADFICFRQKHQHDLRSNFDQKMFWNLIDQHMNRINLSDVAMYSIGVTCTELLGCVTSPEIKFSLTPEWLKFWISYASQLRSQVKSIFLRPHTASEKILALFILSVTTAQSWNRPKALDDCIGQLETKFSSKIVSSKRASIDLDPVQQKRMRLTSLNM